MQILNRTSLNTIVLTVSTKGKAVPFHVPVNPSEGNGLQEKSFVKCEQILTVSKERLIRRVGCLDDERMEAIAGKQKQFYGMEVDPENEIIVSGGATGALYCACLALLNPGDEVILFEPFYGYHTLKPIDHLTIEKIARECSCIVTMEEHSVINGIGTAITEILFSCGYRGKFKKFGIPDEYANVLGDKEWLRDHYGLGHERIAFEIMPY